MKKILCPLDFSDASMNGLTYAFEIAKKFESQLVIFHSVHPQSIPESKGKDLFEIEEDVKEKLEHICESLASQKNYKSINYLFIVKSGLAEDEILKIISENKIDMIIMGSKGATGIDTLFGSLSAEVLSKASCPVIVIPQNFKYREINHIAYATDMKGSESAIIKYIAKFAEISNAHISFLNIQKENHDEAKDMITYGANMLNIANYSNMSFHVIEKEDVIEGINYFSKSNNVDLVVMATYDRGLIKRAFTSSHTKDLAYQAEIPLLAMHKEYVPQSV